MSSTTSSSSLSPSSSSTENDLESDSESRSSQVGTSTHNSQVATSTPQTSTSFPRRDALGEIKDEAKDKFDEDTWFTADEKRNKITKESIVELLEECHLPPPFFARVPALQEPANYGTDLETSVYEGQIRSGYRIPMHPFAVAFFNHYKMTPGQLVPNGWMKLVGLIYLVQTSGYLVTVHDFMRLYLESRDAACGAHSSRPRYACPPTPVLEPRIVSKPKTQELAIGTSSSRTSSLEMAGKGEGAKGDFLGLLQKASKGKRKESTGEAHGVLPSDKLILENQPHEAFAMAHVQAAYNAYCYSSQMQDRFAMAMDVARNAETDKRAAKGKADKLDKEVKNLKKENVDLLTKLGRLEKRCEKLRHEKAEIGNKAIQAFLDGTAGDEWLRKRTKDRLSIFQEGFQKAKELTVAKYPSLFLGRRCGAQL
ncbi:hypothetical protein RJ640_024134 [Escallonia rubra]|uniref:Transposase (putative) gypsy type domain-containing protein n=1 Tax=Escallonia rubra TaxID=112253 RepID=A0AA88R1H1_9ASTE|nr:hypothetical protein RJ640_024134 [Escallonia rubra]